MPYAWKHCLGFSNFSSSSSTTKLNTAHKVNNKQKDTFLVIIVIIIIMQDVIKHNRYLCYPAFKVILK